LIIEICSKLKNHELIKINFLLNNNILNEDVCFIINIIPDRLTEHLINVAMDKKFFIYSKENFRLMETRVQNSRFIISQKTIDKLVNHPHNVKTAKDLLIIFDEL
jgi:RNA-binding protein YhbY